jgi:hypothetical protein
VPLILNTQTGNDLLQFHCIYEEEFATCKRDAKFNSLWQYKAKLQAKAYSIDYVDALPTADKLTKPIVLPDAANPLPRFVEPGDSSPKPEPTEFDAQPDDEHKDNANQPSVETTTPSAPAPERDTPTNANEATTRSRRMVQKPYYFSDYFAHSAFSAYLHTFSPQQQTEDALHLL